MRKIALTLTALIILLFAGCEIPPAGKTPLVTDLEIHAGTGEAPGAEQRLSPAFNAETTEYTAIVHKNIEKIIVSAVLSDEKGTVSFLKEGDEEPNTNGEFTLETGKNIISITAKSGSGEERTYTITVTKLLYNLDLSNITFTVDREAHLNPSFNPDTTEYTIDVIPGTNNPDCNVTVTGVKADENMLITYSPSQTVDVGEIASKNRAQTVTITVTAPDETSKIYRVNVVRRISKAVPQIGYIEIVPNVGDSINVYDAKNHAVTVPSNVDSVTVSVGGMAVNYYLDETRIEYDPKNRQLSNLKTGVPQAVTIKVYAEDRNYFSTYTVTVTRSE